MPLKRGRVSGAQIQIEMLKSGSGFDPVMLPDPPDELTREQGCEWTAIVRAAGADWFSRENHPLLVQLVREIVCARRIAQLIYATESKKTKALDVGMYQSLLRTQTQLSQSIGYLSVKMRLCQSSNYDKSKRKNAVPLELPWEQND